MVHMHYFIFAGEKSGDLHGGQLIRALKAYDSNSQFIGVGGPSMRAEGITCILAMEDFQMMGFSDILFSLPKLWHQFYTVRDAILRQQPACVILIDYPGFNLRLARSLRRRGFCGKIVQYICPSVWAHGRHRIETMAQNLDLLLTIYPFEKDYFAHTSLPVIYIGHPLVETITQHQYEDKWKEKEGISASAPLIALFPGSRPAEIKRHLPYQLKLASLLKDQNASLHFGLSYAHAGLLPSIQQSMQTYPIQLRHALHLIPPHLTYELMRDCQTAIAKSGTVALELALHHRPSVIMYELSTLNYLIAAYLLRLQLPHYCMVNILGKKEIFPELIGKNLSFSQLYQHVERIHNQEEHRKTIIAECQQVRQLLGSSPTHQLAAQAIQELLTC